MRTWIWVVLVWLSVATTVCAAPLTFGPFGELVLRGQVANPEQVVILVSGAAGWGEVEENMARMAAEQKALVIGVNAQEYFARISAKNYEPNVSFELESMNKFVQKSLGLPHLLTPILCGYADGAGVVYASLVQAPADTFQGAVSLGFRPGLPLSQPFGIGRGLTWKKEGRGIVYDAATAFDLPWTVIQAANDPVFPENATRRFMQGMRGANLHVLSGAEGYSDTTAWRQAYVNAVSGLMKSATSADPAAQDISELPLIEVAATGPASDTLAVFISGDGGWAGIDKDIAAILATNGIGVIGLDAMRYFWTKRTPEEGGADLGRVIKHYMKQWGKKRVMLIGFSLGADALPPMVNHLPRDLRGRIRQITLLAPSKSVELEFHISDWMGDDDAAQDIPLLPEVRKLAPLPILCVQGQEETGSLCPDLDSGLATVLVLPGSHHFNGDYSKVAVAMLEHLRRSSK